MESASRECVDTVSDRRELITHLLKAYDGRGGKVLLPIGMSTPEPWLLDTINVRALLEKMQSGEAIELVLFCTRARASGHHSRPNSTMTDDLAGLIGTPRSGTPIKGPTTASPGEVNKEGPVVSLPDLEIVLQEHELHELAFLLFAASCGVHAGRDLVMAVGTQLGISESRVHEIQQALVLVTGVPRQLLDHSVKRVPLQPRPRSSSTGGEAHLTTSRRTSEVGSPMSSTGNLISLSEDDLLTGSTNTKEPQTNPGLSHTVPNIMDIDMAPLTSNRGTWSKSGQSTSKAEGTSRETMSTSDTSTSTSAPPLASLPSILAATTVQSTPATGARLLAHILQQTRPHNFHRFRHYITWRDMLSRVLVFVLEEAVSEGWKGGSKCNEQISARVQMARLKATLRRMAVESAEDYDESDYEEASQRLEGLASTITSCCQSGDRLPWRLRLKVAESLLGAVFDSLDEGSYVDEAPLLLRLLQEHMWPMLGISGTTHGCMFAWVHFRQLVTTKQNKLVGPTRELLLEVVKMSRTSRPSLKRNPGPARSWSEDDPGQLTSVVVDTITTWLEDRLRDHYLHFPRGELLEGALGLLVASAQARGVPENVTTHLVMDIITTSLESLVKRTTAARDEQEEARLETEDEKLLAFMEILEEVVDREVKETSQFFKALLPESPLVSTHHVFSLLGQQYVPWLNSVELLDINALAVIQKGFQLEQSLDGMMKTFREACHDPRVMQLTATGHSWDTTTLLQPVLAKWVQNQVKQFNKWVVRQLETDSWKPINDHCSYSRSAAETSRIVMESLEALFGLGVPLPPEIMSMHMEGVDNILQGYVQYVLDLIGPAARLIPPKPPLTRYKREYAVKVEEEELGKHKSPSRLAEAVLGPQEPKKFFLVSVPPIESSPDCEKLRGLDVSMLVVMCSSLHFLLGALGPLAEVVTRQWKAHRVSSSGRTADLLEGILEAARYALENGITTVMQYLATKLVFWDLRHDWLELLYRHRVVNARIDRLTPVISNELSLIVNLLPNSLKKEAVRAIFKACLQALERVLLDGGPTRIFIPADVEHLDQDLSDLKALFSSNGDGLAHALLDEEISRVRLVIRMMGVETGHLINALKAASHGKVPASPKILLPEEGVVLRVLCHRADHPASKFLKDKYKIPKKLRGSAAS